MPEAGYLPIPRKLAIKGVRDMLRLSDGRMSGTASGSVVLHISPESAIGGPLAAVRDGDTIEVDVNERKLHLRVSDEEIQSRLDAWRTQKEQGGHLGQEIRGYRRLYKERVLQADRGADFDFLTSSGR